MKLSVVDYNLAKTPRMRRALTPASLYGVHRLQLGCLMTSSSCQSCVSTSGASLGQCCHATRPSWDTIWGGAPRPVHKGGAPRPARLAAPCGAKALLGCPPVMPDTITTTHACAAAAHADGPMHARPHEPCRCLPTYYQRRNCKRTLSLADGRWHWPYIATSAAAVSSNCTHVGIDTPFGCCYPCITDRCGRGSKAM